MDHRHPPFFVTPEYLMPGASGGDDTAALLAAIAAVPDGSRITFQPDPYITDGVMYIDDRHDLVFDCLGATFTASTLGDRNRAHWRLNNSTNLTFNDTVVIGSNPNGGLAEEAYNPLYEAQHGFEIKGCTNITINRPTITDIWGDFIYIASGFPINQTTWTDGVEVQGFTFARNGRQAFGVVAARNIAFHHGTIDDVRRSILDLEPNLPGTVQGCRDLTLRDTTIGAFRLSFLASLGAGGDIGDVTITRNTLTDPTNGTLLTIMAGPDPALPRGPFTITDNTSTAGYGTGGDAVVMYFYNVDGLTVTGNTQPLQVRTPTMALVGLDTCTNYTVSGNTVTGGIESRIIT